MVKVGRGVRWRALWRGLTEWWRGLWRGCDAGLTSGDASVMRCMTSGYACLPLLGDQQGL